MSNPLSGRKKEQAENFYGQIIDVLRDRQIPFMIGGTYAFSTYTGIQRPTGDLDVKIPYDNHSQVLRELTEAGFQPELTEVELNWLAKVKSEDGFYADFIFGERNNLHKIDKTWFDHAKRANVLGREILLEPIEEMIRSKCYVQNRHRTDAGNVVHLILRQGKEVDWHLLLEKMDPHWELLMSHILIFLFVYPSERGVIPKWVIEHLVIKLRITYPTRQRRTVLHVAFYSRLIIR